MKTSLIIAISILLSGCATGTFSNRVACTVAKDEALFISKYGPIGFSATIDDKDRAVICK